MHIKKVSDDIYEVRKSGYPRALFRGSLEECVEFMQLNIFGY